MPYYIGTGRAESRSVDARLGGRDRLVSGERFMFVRRLSARTCAVHTKHRTQHPRGHKQVCYGLGHPVISCYRAAVRLGLSCSTDSARQDARARRAAKPNAAASESKPINAISGSSLAVFGNWPLVATGARWAFSLRASVVTGLDDGALAAFADAEALGAGPYDASTISAGSFDAFSPSAMRASCGCSNRPVISTRWPTNGSNFFSSGPAIRYAVPAPCSVQLSDVFGELTAAVGLEEMFLFDAVSLAIETTDASTST